MTAEVPSGQQDSYLLKKENERKDGARVHYASRKETNGTRYVLT